jgi:hypothetical protein
VGYTYQAKCKWGSPPLASYVAPFHHLHIKDIPFTHSLQLLLVLAMHTRLGTLLQR